MKGRISYNAKLLVLAAALTLSQNLELSAQFLTTRFKSFTVNEGLSNNFINAFLQDEAGFLWIATSDGLNRFDGYSFKVFISDFSDETSLPENTITCLTETPDGLLWMGTEASGFCSFDPDLEKFETFSHRESDRNSILDNRITAIAADPDTSKMLLWIGTRSGLTSFNYVSGEIHNFVLPFSYFKKDKPNYAVRAIQFMHGGKIWIGSDNGIFIFTPPTAHWEFLNDDLPAELRFSNNKILSMAKGGRNTLWIGTQSGINRMLLSAKTGEEKIISLKSYSTRTKQKIAAEEIISVLTDKRGYTWAGLFDGLIRIDPAGKIRKYVHESSNPLSLPANRINTVFEDRNGRIWFGSGGNGFFCYDPSAEGFQLFTHNPKNPNSLSASGIRGIYEDAEGILWVGTNSGLNRIDRKNSSITRINTQNSELSNDLIYCVTGDPKDSSILWLGCEGGGLIKYNSVTGEADSFLKTDYKKSLQLGNALTSNFIYDIEIASDGRLWLATNRGVNIFNPSDKSFSFILNTDIDPDVLSSNTIRAILEDSRGMIWIGTNSRGVNIYDPVAETIKPLTGLTKRGEAHASNKVKAIFEDASGDIWIGTNGSGLLRIHLSGREVESINQFSTNHGLPNNVVYGILEDSQGSLWLSTNYGLSRFDREHENFKNFSVEDGLQDNEFNTGSFFKAKSGEMFFGGVRGFNAFYPEKAAGGRTLPTVVLTGMKIFNEIIQVSDSNSTGFFLQKAISQIDEIVLDYDQNTFSFQYSALEFSAPQKLQYAYKLEGYDQEWFFSDYLHRTAGYSHVPPGEYKLKIKTAFDFNSGNEIETELNLIILQPWWRTWWAYLIYGILAVSLFYFIRLDIIRRVTLKANLELEHKQTENLEKLDKLKNEFFTNISHEFRTPLSLLLDPISKLRTMKLGRKPADLLSVMHRNAVRLKVLTDELLDLNKLTAGKFETHRERRNIVLDIKEISEMFRTECRNRNIALIFNSENDSVKFNYPYEFIEKIFYNLISNAVNFSFPEGMVSISIFEEENKIVVSIADLGCGIEAAKLKRLLADIRNQRDRESDRPSGLMIVKDMLKLVDGSMEVKSNAGEGTQVKISIPIPELPREEVEEALDLESLSETKKDPNAGEYSKLILIVEDSPDILRYLRYVLGEVYTVVAAKDGEEGLKKAVELIPDLILSDIRMPKMDGIEMLKILKSDERTSHIPIIFLTAKTAVEDRIAGLKIGADDYISKPFESKELIARIENLITQRRMLREKFADSAEYKIKETAVTPADEKFIIKALDVLETHISASNFSVEDFSKEMGLSRVQFFRKIKSLTDKAPNEFIRDYRLKRAVQLLNKNFGSVSDVAYEVGFENLNYFSKCFKKFTGKTPSDFKNEPQKN